MEDEVISMEEIIEKTITDIRCKYGNEEGWLDTAECFIELNNKFFISIPYGESKSVYEIEVDPDAMTIFKDFSDIPYYHVNKEGKSISEVIQLHKKRKQHIFNRLKKLLFGFEPSIKEYQPYKIEYHENKLKYVINRTIVDYWWETEETEKGFFELDNGYLISEQYMAPSGTGLAGLHYYDSLESLKKSKGEALNSFLKLTKENR